MQTTVHVRKSTFGCLVRPCFKISCVVSSGSFFYFSVYWEHLHENFPRIKYYQQIYKIDEENR